LAGTAEESGTPHAATAAAKTIALLNILIVNHIFFQKRLLLPGQIYFFLSDRPNDTDNATTRQHCSSLHIPSQITIGNNVWIGAQACTLPGVTTGDNSVIGAGNPCRIIREILHTNHHFRTLTESSPYFYSNEKAIRPLFQYSYSYRKYGKNVSYTEIFC